jgi:hypothetical protein
MHDPLCFEFDNKDECGFDHSLQSPFCYCELIAKVREDERAILQFDLMADKFHAYQDSFEEGYKMGKEHERENCIEEIASFYTSGDNTEYWRGFDKGLIKAISLLKMGMQ